MVNPSFAFLFFAQNVNSCKANPKLMGKTVKIVIEIKTVN